MALYRKKEEEDPASVYYKRKLSRPALHPLRTALFVLAALLLAAAVGTLAYTLWERRALAVWTGIGVLLLILLLFFKRICIFLVRVYQRFAPESIRNRCRYEPSCSEYMILAIQKHGVIRGVMKGCGRLKRCKPPNGGMDPP